MSNDITNECWCAPLNKWRETALQSQFTFFLSTFHPFGFAWFWWRGLGENIVLHTVLLKWLFFPWTFQKSVTSFKMHQLFPICLNRPPKPSVDNNSTAIEKEPHYSVYGNLILSWTAVMHIDFLRLIGSVGKILNMQIFLNHTRCEMFVILFHIMKLTILNVG